MGCSNLHCEHEEKSKLKLILNIFGIIAFIVAIILKNNYIFLASYILLAYDICINAIKGIFKKEIFDENLLMSIATIGACIIGDYAEGIAVIILYKIGEYLQEMAVNKSKKSLEKAVDIRSNEANLVIGNDIKVVEAKSVKIGDVILIKVGEKIPLDCEIIEGSSTLDTSSLTGESMPKEVNIGEEILSGSINISGILKAKVTKDYSNSTISKILDMLENAVNRKSKTEKYITKFARVYTPIVVVLAILVALVNILFLNIEIVEGIKRALIFLVISCPCALVLSIPLGFFAGIGKCSKSGIVIKGSNFLDILSNVNMIFFDKTGTLTKGNFNVTKIQSVGDLDSESIIKYISMCERMSSHYIAKAIVSKYKTEEVVKDYEELAGFGIKAKYNDKNIIVGNDKLLDKFNIYHEDIKETGTIIYLAIDNKCEGYIILKDEIKEDTKLGINSLKEKGIRTVMLTGDKASVANNVAKELGIDKVYSELLPQDKERIQNELKLNSVSAYVGDGINDALTIASADVGISMGMGSDIAIETSDIVIMTDEISKISKAIDISKYTKKIIKQNIIFAILVKLAFLILGGFGIATMWEAVFADVGVTVLSVLNCLRIFRK